MAKSPKTAIKDDVRALSGAERAAVIMLSLGEEHSAKIWALMDEEEVKEVSQVMSNLGSISSNVIEKLLVDFVSQMSGTGSLMGSYESTERLIARFMPQEKVAQIMEEIRGPAGRTMWDKLANVNESVLANYLKNEYPQTVSVVLSKIKPEHAARVLGALPEEFALEVVQRMLRMESVQKDILDKVEQTLRVEFMSNLARTAKRDSHEHMAEIFNNFDRQTENRFITALEERSRDSAERIKALMFTFEDLVRIDTAGIQTLLRSVEKDKLAVALKGGSETVKDLFFKNMSERAGKMLKEDMDAMGPVRLRDVDQAQSMIVTMAKELAASGQIVISEGREEDELIY
jgi:flagellar motor switch protein FliG